MNRPLRPFGMRDKLGYMFGDFGNDFTFILSTSILMKFYTDVMGVSAGIVGTLLCGWLSSKYFKGRCAPVNVIYMLLVAVGVVAYWQAMPIAQMLAVDVKYVVYVSLALIGAAIYGPVAMISIQAISIVPKNAAGTAAGFMGLLGYLVGDAILSKIAFGYVAESSLGWNFTFECFFATSIIAAVICFVAMGKEKKMLEDRIAAAAENK